MSSFSQTCLPSDTLCLYAQLLLPRPWKYLPSTRQQYTLMLDSETEQTFSKSKSSRSRLICECQASILRQF